MTVGSDVVVEVSGVVVVASVVAGALEVVVVSGMVVEVSGVVVVASVIGVASSSASGSEGDTSGLFSGSVGCTRATAVSRSTASGPSSRKVHHRKAAMATPRIATTAPTIILVLVLI